MEAINEDYVSFETARLLRIKGFNEDVNTYRDKFIQNGNIVIPLQECLSKDKIKTPTIQRAIKWLRIKHNFYILINPLFGFGKEVFWDYSIDTIENGNRVSYVSTDTFDSPEKAANEAIMDTLMKIKE